MVSFDEFAALEVGQVVLVNNTPRVVRHIQVTHTSWGRRASVTFAIRRHSWTGRILTVQGWNDLKHRMKILPRWHQDTDRIAALEDLQLRQIGFDVQRELERELRENIAINERMIARGCEPDPMTAAVSLTRRALACAKRKARRSH